MVRNQMQQSILVFKTNLAEENDLEAVASMLNEDPAIVKWNVDTEDIDNVLRIVADNIKPCYVEALIQQVGYFCEELPD